MNYILEAKPNTKKELRRAHIEFKLRTAPVRSMQMAATTRTVNNFARVAETPESSQKFQPQSARGKPFKFSYLVFKLFFIAFLSGGKICFYQL